MWADDEMELLRAHILFLEKKGYDVVTVTNGTDAIDQCRQKTFDLILLDEMMPGLSGLETLQKIKEISPATPVVMVTKSEEENIMDQAIGSKIADYLIKPVNPNQILLSLKKNIHQKEIVTEVTQSGYQQSFQDIAMQINDCKTISGWMDVYRRIVHWELELSNTDSNMTEMLKMQKEEADNGFARYVKAHYMDWMDEIMRGQSAGNPQLSKLKSVNPSLLKQQNKGEERPMMSVDIFKKKIFPLLDAGEKVFMIVIDNFRLDQWRMLSQEIGDMFDIDEQTYVSILPTATQYARNAIFSGLMPVKIAEMFPDLWVDEDEEEGKNLNESPLVQTLLDRYRKRYSFSYNKINDSAGGEKLLQNFANLSGYDLNVLVINFVDMLSHARTESKMIRELAYSDAAYRSLTESWFKHSAVTNLLKQIASHGYRVVLTTDHGTVRVNNPIKVIGDRATNTNLRYKLGKNLSYNPKQVYEIKQPLAFGLPSPNISTTYIFASNRDFFAYPNNYNHYVQYYNDTFQHGGISMEEMIIPIVTMSKK